MISLSRLRALVVAKNQSQVSVRIMGKAGGVLLPLPFNQKDGCKGSGLDCPLVAGRNYTVSRAVRVYRIYPKARACHYQQLPSVSTLESSSCNVYTSLPGIRNIIHSVVREEIRKLLPAIRSTMSTGGAHTNGLACEGSCRTTLDHVSRSVRGTLRIIFGGLCLWCRHYAEAPDPHHLDERACRPEEVAEVVKSLCSPKSSYVAGAAVDVAGLKREEPRKIRETNKDGRSKVKWQEQGTMPQKESAGPSNDRKSVDVTQRPNGSSSHRHIPHTFLEIPPKKKTHHGPFVLNICSAPSEMTGDFGALFHDEIQVDRPGRDSLVIVGNFNAAHLTWGYVKESPKGRREKAGAATIAKTDRDGTSYSTGSISHITSEAEEEGEEKEAEQIDTALAISRAIPRRVPTDVKQGTTIVIYSQAACRVFAGNIFYPQTAHLINAIHADWLQAPIIPVNWTPVRITPIPSPTFSSWETALPNRELEGQHRLVDRTRWIAVANGAVD
ncbi:hypothetical protein HPB47_005637 [Ixodes persulcatus]|uniref:Uncharacterized protein n=1 Tax=Ixodes persulcatus TaxID=34615 RepID=A0AC60PDP0_IXOPE|nr:hypothetical protein HPB47_005637 [Ixodes persulcatus]